MTVQYIIITQVSVYTTSTRATLEWFEHHPLKYGTNFRMDAICVKCVCVSSVLLVLILKYQLHYIHSSVSYVCVVFIKWNASSIDANMQWNEMTMKIDLSHPGACLLKFQAIDSHDSQESTQLTRCVRSTRIAHLWLIPIHSFGHRIIENHMVHKLSMNWTKSINCFFIRLKFKFDWFELEYTTFRI